MSENLSSWACVLLMVECILQDLHREYNEKFFHLTPQNLRIRNDVLVAFIMFRLGQHDEWTYMGMTTFIIDANGKFRKAATGSSGSGGGSNRCVCVLFCMKKRNGVLTETHTYIHWQVYIRFFRGGGHHDQKAQCRAGSD